MPNHRMLTIILMQDICHIKFFLRSWLILQNSRTFRIKDKEDAPN